MLSCPERRLTLKEKRVQIGVRLPEQFVKEFRVQCILDGTTVQEVLEKAAKKYMENRAQEKIILSMPEEVVKESLQQSIQNLLQHDVVSSAAALTEIAALYLEKLAEFKKRQNNNPE